jgi:hypothetical protein
VENEGRTRTPQRHGGAAIPVHAVRRVASQGMDLGGAETFGQRRENDGRDAGPDDEFGAPCPPFPPERVHPETEQSTPPGGRAGEDGGVQDHDARYGRTGPDRSRHRGMIVQAQVAPVPDEDGLHGERRRHQRFSRWRNVTRAALRPEAPMMPPPGCVLAPLRKSPRRCVA